MTTTPGAGRSRGEAGPSPRDDQHDGRLDDQHGARPDDRLDLRPGPAGPEGRVPSPPDPAPQPGTPAASGVPADRPVSRRELRERERIRVATSEGERSAAPAAPVVASLAALAGRAPARQPAGHGADRASAPAGDADPVAPRPDHEDLAPYEPYGYTWKHLGVLAAVAGALGLLVWSLTTADGSGADGARAIDPTTSSSPTTRGEP